MCLRIGCAWMASRACVVAGAGFRSSVIVAGVVAYLHFNVQSLSWVYDHFLQLAAAAVVWSFVLATFLYLKSFRADALLADGGNTGTIPLLRVGCFTTGVQAHGRGKRDVAVVFRPCRGGCGDEGEGGCFVSYARNIHFLT